MSTPAPSTPPRAWPDPPPLPPSPSGPGPEVEPDDGDDDGRLTVPDHLVRAVLITDPHQVRRLKARREQSPAAPRDEMWEGIYVMSPLANNEHQILVLGFATPFSAVVDLIGGDQVYPGVNVSDRVQKWKANYREPDVAVYLKGNPAQDCKTHMVGGPDLAVEILSRGDLARDKRGFYAAVGTRELLILDRYPWAVELYRLVDGELVLAGTSSLDRPEPVASHVLPLTFRVVAGQPRPRVEVTRLDGAQTWSI